MANYTPMMEQYREIKSRHPHEILFFRLGDFYEMFFEDAELASRELEITLTSREGGHNIRVPMCGVPYHSADNYIARLIQKGYKVAICEQVEDPKQAKGIVRREVIKIITPGTVLTETLLAERANNYLVLLAEAEAMLVAVAADISTGECMWADFSGAYRLPALCDYLYSLRPAEIVLTGSIENHVQLDEFIKHRLPECSQTSLAVDDEQVLQQLPMQHFSPAELPHDKAARRAIGLLLYYLHETIKSDLSHINRLVKHDASNYLLLDAATLRNLEITRNMRDGGKKGTLLAVLDFTKTAMGGRLLKKWLEAPLLNPVAITNRQDAIEELVQRPSLRQCFQEQLSHIYDFERILTRIEIGTANARDLVALKSSLQALPNIDKALRTLTSKFMSDISAKLNKHDQIAGLIEKAINDNPPLSVREGGMIKAGFNQELDELRQIATDSKAWIQELERKEREATGIKSLKIGYNKVFGYYIEVTHANAAGVPASYIRKQTLANAERYITPELKEFETKILGAHEKIIALEYHLFNTLREHIKQQMQMVQETARQVAQLDAIVSLSEAAVRYNYVRPQITPSRQIIIKDGRHPVVERLIERAMFVPNDTHLDHGDNEIMIITGPNMAGKSTYMRQVALLVLMAQVGSFIPAREAAICPVDRIFTRIGASDDLATGQSTFMVEMNEVAQILKYATANSLIILDEIGRGTSTFDGMSIARAVIEYIKERVKAKTLFATHYHELTQLSECMHGIKNYSVAVKERGKEIVFLRRIVPGGADKSYGVHVAQLAGLPPKIITRAQELLTQLEANHGSACVPISQTAAAAATPAALSLFDNALAQELLSIDVMTITPLEALNILFKLQQQAKQEAGQN